MLEATKVIEASDQVATSIVYREIGRSLLSERGIKAAKAAAGRIARLRRAMHGLRIQAFSSGLAVAPSDGAVAGINAVAKAQPFADMQQYVGRDGYKRTQEPGDRFASAAPSRPSERLLATGQTTPRSMAHAGATPNAVNSLPGSTTNDATKAASVARTADIGRSAFARRSGGRPLSGPLSPVRQPTDLMLHVSGGEGSRYRGNQHLHPMIARIQSRVSTLPRMSLAPTNTAVHPDMSSALPRQGRSYEVADSLSVPQPEAALDERRLNRLISDQLERIAMRPSAGMTGYDPRVSPNYPGAPSDV